MTPQPKVYGFKLPSVVTDGSCVSVTLQFPDILEYRAAFNGQINMLGKWFQWAHTQADYQDIPAFNQDVAELWVQVLADASWEICMEFCAHIIQCLETDADVQQAFADYLASNPLARQAMQELVDNGSLAISGAGTVLMQTNDLDVLFGACTFVTDTIYDAITDFYQAFELGTNAREHGEIIFRAIPIVETLPINEISEYISTLEEDVAEGFSGQWTTTPITGSRDRIRCAIFCAARDNGNTLTLEIVEDYFWSRVGYTVTNIANVTKEFIEFLATGSWAGQEIVDVSFGTWCAAMRGTQKFGDMVFPSFATIVQLGMDNPETDWPILCEDCPDITWCRSYVGGDLQSLGTPSGGLGAQAEWTGTGWGANDAVIPARITIECDLGSDVTITSVEIIFSGENADGDTDTVTIYTEDFIVSLGSDEFTQDTTIDVTNTGLQIFEIDTVSSFSPTAVPITVEIVEIIVRGIGTAPTSGTEC